MLLIVAFWEQWLPGSISWDFSLYISEVNHGAVATTATGSLVTATPKPVQEALRVPVTITARLNRPTAPSSRPVPLEVLPECLIFPQDQLIRNLLLLSEVGLK